MATRQKRISIQLKEETYNQLKEVSEKQGMSMSTLAMHMVAQNVQVYKQMYEMLSDPLKLAELSKAMGLQGKETLDEKE